MPTYTKLVWADEFNIDGLPDTTKWQYDIGKGPNGDGWGNQEKQYYTNRKDNAEVKNGKLHITLKKEPFQGSEYTSARLLTQGKYTLTYGKVEARIKLPQGIGTWPAFWMLGENIKQKGWPACGEIDIMEHVGREQNKIYGTLHYPERYGANCNGTTTMISNATTDFHIYTLEWTPTYIHISVDGKTFFTFDNTPQTVFNAPHFLLLNIAIGGGLGGTIDPLFTSATMEVDYVRIYQ